MGNDGLDLSKSCLKLYVFLLDPMSKGQMGRIFRYGTFPTKFIEMEPLARYYYRTKSSVSFNLVRKTALVEDNHPVVKSGPNKRSIPEKWRVKEKESRVEEFDCNLENATRIVGGLFFNRSFWIDNFRRT